MCARRLLNPNIHILVCELQRGPRITRKREREATELFTDENAQRSMLATKGAEVTGSVSVTSKVTSVHYTRNEHADEVEATSVSAATRMRYANEQSRAQEDFVCISAC